MMSRSLGGILYLSLLETELDCTRARFKCSINEGTRRDDKRGTRRDQVVCCEGSGIGWVIDGTKRAIGAINGRPKTVRLKVGAALKSAKREARL
jgi:hypothetical protein